MTTLTLTNEDGTYTIMVRNSALTAQGLIDELVAPIMLAAGYQPKSVNDCLCTDDCMRVPPISTEGEDDDSDPMDGAPVC